VYQLVPTIQFKRDLKKIKSKPRDFALVTATLKTLQNKGVKGIPANLKPHKLKGNYADNWECHIKPDLLILWIQIETPKIIRLVRLGTHSELFK
jgi:mRNA interferase YafQ